MLLLFPPPDLLMLFLASSIFERFYRIGESELGGLSGE